MSTGEENQGEVNEDDSRSSTVTLNNTQHIFILKCRISVVKTMFVVRWFYQNMFYMVGYDV